MLFCCSKLEMCVYKYLIQWKIQCSRPYNITNTENHKIRNYCIIELKISCECTFSEVHNLHPFDCIVCDAKLHLYAHRK